MAVEQGSGPEQSSSPEVLIKQIVSLIQQPQGFRMGEFVRLIEPLVVREGVSVCPSRFRLPLQSQPSSSLDNKEVRQFVNSLAREPGIWKGFIDDTQALIQQPDSDQPLRAELTRRIAVARGMGMESNKVVKEYLGYLEETLIPSLPEEQKLPIPESSSEAFEQRLPVGEVKQSFRERVGGAIASRLHGKEKSPVRRSTKPYEESEAREVLAGKIDLAIAAAVTKANTNPGSFKKAEGEEITKLTTVEKGSATGLPAGAESPEAESLIPPENKEEIVRIVAQIQEVYKSQKGIDYPYVLIPGATIDGSDRADLATVAPKVQKLQEALSTLLRLRDDESFQQAVELRHEGSLLPPTFDVDSLLEYSWKRGAFDTTARLLEKMYKNAPQTLQDKLITRITEYLVKARRVPYEHYSINFAKMERDTLGIDFQQRENLSWQYDGATNTFTDLVTGRKNGSLDGFVQAFIDRNHINIAFQRQVIQDRRLVIGFHSRLAELAGVKVSFPGPSGLYGDAVLEEIAQPVPVGNLAALVGAAKSSEPDEDWKKVAGLDPEAVKAHKQVLAGLKARQTNKE